MGPSVVSVGNFDGVHRGHELLVRTLKERAGFHKASSVILTFEPHTRAAINPGETVPLLSVFEEKATLFDRLGVDVLVRIVFNDSIRSMGPVEFANRILSQTLGAVEWVMGNDHRYGKGANGDKNSLRDQASTNHINTLAVNLQAFQGQNISSTAIRNRIGEGKIAQAMEMLGHPYLIAAKRVPGHKVGSRLGFPTLNFSGVVPEKVVPPAGVYAARLECAGTRMDGALYFGDCPTFGNRDVHFEFHVLGPVTVEPKQNDPVSLWLYKYIGPDRKFDTSSGLAARIEKDVVSIKHFFTQES